MTEERKVKSREEKEEEQVERKDGEAHVTVSRDEMEAYLTIVPPKGGAPVTREIAKKALLEMGIQYGFIEEEIDRAILEMNPMDSVLVAKGKVATHGKDGIIEYRFSTDNRIQPVELDNGRVDFYNLNLIKNVQVGEILAVKIAPTAGESGMTVKGNELKAKPGKDVRIAFGKNTQLSPDEMILTATLAGHVHVNGGKISVDPVYELRGDVDFASGNLNFLGTVLVRGSITYGFSVQCEGDLEIGGSIDGGSVTVGGNLTVRQGIQGQQRSIIDVKGNVLSKFIQNATIKAGGDVMVGEAIMHSYIDAGTNLMVGGKKGLIVGGQCRTGREIAAKTIGSLHATVTELEVGVCPRVRQKYSEAIKKLEENRSNLDKTQKAIKVLKDWEARLGSLAEDKRMLLLRLTRTQFQLLKTIKDLEAEREVLELRLDEGNRGKIRAASCIYPGVAIKIGQYTTRIRDKIDFATALVEDGELHFKPYNY
ncbi:DUF342 domain-containing protein [Heliorestis convoluta]|uniref:Flagellar Assembly Protein A N-terminal region domain-containing protein n=1 Tax=Heliorestis convoluta TaxID=356322 RepID=A0A5Q2N3M4_9FIRM|nr:FapA family protein [Heliorestis convoluta]QGG48196.1 hypothetical protein FTV88_2098 [Heliorestis convoluta]